MLASRSTTAIDAPTIAGAIEFENRYGRERWRRRSTISFFPVVKPPAAPPSALPSVEVITSTFACTPKCSGVPRPVFPMKPLACESSTITIAPYFSASSQMRSSFARYPSIEKTPSVAIIRSRFPCVSTSAFSSAAMSPFG